MIARLHQRVFRAMGTTCAVAVTAGSSDARRAQHAFSAALAEVDACERALSRFDDASDLSRLNRAGGGWTAVDERLLEALRAALRARAYTGGKFDPTILPALAAAGYDRSFELLEERTARVADGWRPGARIELDPKRGRARIEPDAAVDLGGIGKGFTATRAIWAMREAWSELAGAFVDLGGDIAFWGTPPGRGPWRVAVADPLRADSILGTLEIASGGVATSGRDQRRFGPGRTLHHLINPTTGFSAQGAPLAVTVVAPDAAVAEAYATALGVTPFPLAPAYVAVRPEIAALVVPAVGEPLVLGDLPLANALRPAVQA